MKLMLEILIKADTSDVRYLNFLSMKESLHTVFILTRTYDV